MQTILRNSNNVWGIINKRFKDFQNNECILSQAIPVLKSQNENNKQAGLQIVGISDKQTENCSEKTDSLIHFLKTIRSKTPDSKLIFGSSKVSDTASKNMISGVEKILNAKQNNPKEYEQAMELSELTQEGNINPEF